MTATESELSRRAAQLARDFDDAFTRAHAGERPPELELLLIRVAERRYLLRLGQVLSVQADRKLVPVPSPRSELLGLVAMRGMVCPVYDLAPLLGHPPEPGSRWLAQVQSAAPFAVAFQGFERHLRLPVAALASAPAVDGAHPFTRESAKTEHGPLPLVDLQAIFEGVTGRGGVTDPREGRR